MIFNYTEIKLSMEWLDGGSWIRHMREFENNAATPIRPAQESPSNTLVLESNEDDTVNDDATEIKSSRESHNNTSFLEATETETQNHEPVDGVELPLPHESDDMMDDVATPIIDPQEIPRALNIDNQNWALNIDNQHWALKIKPSQLRVKRRDLSSSSSVRVCSDTNPQPHLLICFYIPPFSISLITKTYFSMVVFNYHRFLLIPVMLLRLWPLGERMSKSDDKIALPKRISEPGTNGGVLDRINKRSNLKLVGKKGFWFSFGEQLMRFFLREFHLATGLPCVVDKDEEERLRLGATILVEGILMASNPYPWGNLAFDYLRKEVESFTYTKNDEIQFPLCLHWIETKSLTIEEVDVKCIFGDPELHSDLVEDVDTEVDENNSAPGIDATGQEKIEFLTKMVVSLEEKVKYLEGLLNIRGETVKETEKSKETEADTKTKVYGQNADYEFDETEFLQNYIDAKRQEIAKGKKNGVRPPREVDHQDEDDIEVEHGAKESDTSKVNEPQEENEHHEEDDTEVDVDDSAKGNENSETNKGQTQEEEEQQQEDDTEVNADVDVGAKESENSETNEDGEVNEDASKKPVKVTKKRGRGNKGKKKSVKPPREVQQQVEDDAEIGAKESENPETNEDGEMNEDASKKPLKVTKKRGRGNKDEEVNEDAFKKPVKGTKKRGRETKGMKKGVAPPREVQQQVEYDAEVDAKESENPKTNEDGEVNEDASKKHVKFTKKCERVTKVNISLCIMVYKMFFQISLTTSNYHF
ncbi:unnamed protein product [Brassica oleracea var. botrytis]